MILLILLPPALVNFKSSSFVHSAFQSSFDIVITFSVVCCCTFLRWIAPLSSAEHVPNSKLIVRCIKSCFQQVVIYPNWTSDEKVMFVLLRRYASSREISERAALKDLSITLHTDLQNSWFLMRWKVDMMELHNNLLFPHGTYLILDEKLIATATLHRWWWSKRTIFFSDMLHTYCLSKQIFPKTLVFKTNWHGGIPCLSTFFFLGVGTR